MYSARDAEHEAGHALAAILLGVAPDYSAVECDGGGNTRIPGLSSAAPHTRLRVLVAGEVAETIMRGHARTWVAGDDREMARAAIRRTGRIRDQDNPWDHPDGAVAWAECEHALRKNRQHLARLAAELEVCLRITGPTMARVLGKLPALQPWTGDDIPIRPALDWRADNARRRRLLELDSIGR